MPRETVIIGLLGSVLDSGSHQERRRKLRPTVSLLQPARRICELKKVMAMIGSSDEYSY